MRILGESRKEDDTEAIAWLLEHEDDRLTSWEVDFLESIQEQKGLSFRQREVLNRIWGDVMNKRGGGRGR